MVFITLVQTRKNKRRASNLDQILLSSIWKHNNNCRDSNTFFIMKQSTHGDVGNKAGSEKPASGFSPKKSPSPSATASSSSSQVLSPHRIPAVTKEEKEEDSTAVSSRSAARDRSDESFLRRRQESNKKNKFLLVVPPDDSFDDRSYDDPYLYSDDSGSLSDAYFKPQQQEAAVAGSDFFYTSESECESDYLNNNRKYAYGAFGERSQSPPSSAAAMRYQSPSPVGLNVTTILEDSPVTQEATPLIPNYDHQLLSATPARLSTRQLKKQQRHRMRIQRKLQDQRERAVTEIRGKPQPPTAHHDTFWLFLFVVQLLFVFGCAIRYGWALMKPAPLLQDMNVWYGSGDHNGGNDNNSNGRHLKNDPFFMPHERALHHVRGRNVSLSSNNTVAPAMAFDVNSDKTPKDLKSLQDDDFIQQEGTVKNGKSKNVPRESTALPASNTNSAETTATTTTTTNAKNAAFSIDYRNVITLFLISGTYACIASYLSFGFMLIVARSLIPIMLVFTTLLALCWGVFGLTVFTHGTISILGFSFCILSMAYALVCWNRIPFCSTNLYTAICAMRGTPGILLVGIGSLWIAAVWCLIWAIAVMGIINTNNTVDCQLLDDCEAHIEWGSDRSLELAILIFSFYWTNMVIKNVVRVTVAGAVGAWWFAAPRQAWCCCESTVWGPLGRSCSNSLGSICMGSLLVLPAQTISVLGSCCCWVAGSGHFHDALVTKPTKTKKGDNDGGHETARDGVDGADEHHHGLTKECSGMMDRLARKLRCCNRWSFTYIGMYGYSFAEGGEKAIQLFETREWMDIVRDNLIQNILFMASIVIGGSTGTFSVLVEEVDGYTFTSLDQPILTAFWIGSALGFVLSNILLLGVVGSAVNTVLVCFAADPFEFDKHHPRLSREMREVWSQQVWEPTEEGV